MPIRTLNYTNRKRIKREDAIITIRKEKCGNAFDAALNLAGYKLPGEARVFVEAYRQTQLTRYDFGQVGALHNPEDRVLRDFDLAPAAVRLPEGTALSGVRAWLREGRLWVLASQDGVVRVVRNLPVLGVEGGGTSFRVVTEEGLIQITRQGCGCSAPTDLRSWRPPVKVTS